MDDHAGHDDAGDLQGGQEGNTDHAGDSILAGQVGHDGVPVALPDQGQEAPEALAERSPDEKNREHQDPQGGEPVPDLRPQFFYGFHI